MDFTKVDKNTLRITQTVSEDITINRLLEEKENLSKLLVSLEVNYKNEKDLLVGKLSLIEASLEEANKLKIVAEVKDEITQSK